MSVCVFSRIVCGIPAWLSICLLSLVVWQYFSGPLIQYGHFTVPGGKSRYSAQHTWCTHPLPDLQGIYWILLGRCGGPRCRNQAQILTPDQSAPLWA